MKLEILSADAPKYGGALESELANICKRTIILPIKMHQMHGGGLPPDLGLSYLYASACLQPAHKNFGIRTRSKSAVAMRQDRVTTPRR